MGPGNALPQYSFTPPRPPDPSNFGLYGGCYSRSDCYRLQGTHHFRRELTQFSSQPSYPPWPPSQTTIHGYVFPHQFPHLSAHLSANARPPPPASSAHHYHFQSYHFQQPTPPGHYPPSPPIDPNPQNTPYHFQHQPPVIIGHPTAPLSPLLPYHVASVYPNPQHESLNPPVNYPHSDSSISHHQTQSKANIISQSTLSFTYGNVFGGDRDGTPTTKRFKLIRVNQNLRVRSQILMKRKPLSKLARRSRTQIHGDSKTDRCGALLITSAEPNAFDVPVETSPASVPVMIVAAVIESTPKHLGQKTHMGNHVDMFDLNSQLQRLVKICIVKDARKVFDKRPKRDAVSWTSMISGYVRVSDSSKALALFSNMWVQPQVFNRVSSVCGTMHSTCYSPSLCGKRREYHALYMFDKMLPSDRMCNAGRTIIAPRSIRDKGGGLTNHREIFYASDYFGLPNARSQIHYTIRLTAVSEMAICFVSAKQDNGGFIEDKELEQSLSGHTSGIDSVSFDSSEVLVAIGAASGTIKLWDLEEAKIVCTLIDHRSNCISVDFHPFGEFFASHSLDTNLKIWDIRKKGCIHTYKGHTQGVNAIRFTPDGLWVVSGGEDNTVKLWDLTDGKLLHDFKCNEGQIQCIGFHPHEFQLATGSADGTVNFWDLDTFELIGSAGPETPGVRSLIFSLDGRALLCGLHESLKVFSWEPIRCHDAVDVGLVTLQLPDHDVTFNSAEDAQNRVATYTLCQLFPDLPIHLVITAPYAALVVQWKEGETITNVEDSVKDRRATFVDSLLKADGSTSTFAANVVYDSDSLPNVVLQLQVQEPRNAKLNPHKDAESSYLRQELENKHKKQKFKEMLKARAALPIAGLKGDILQLLHDNNVLIVCGETGSGKTTQVPQFILDDMIQSGRGGHCNIICTQPWRIEAISVADRVADERCEPSPGSNGSLVGYQVRLDNASNEKTKLLFCTTGILLRKFVGDRNLSGITHVIVHEVHERSLLGDFLLIVLKNLIEKQSALNTPKLKVILISATVDSNLFSNYFGGCPVITAEGKFHKLSQRYYGPVQVVERVGKVAYKMQLPVTAKIHDVFHVSLLKKKLGDLISAQPQLPHIIDPENPRGEPFAVLDRRVLKKRGAVINQWLVQWLGTSPDKATWEDVETILLRYPSFDRDMEIPTGPAPIEIDFLACLNLGSSSV